LNASPMLSRVYLVDYAPPNEPVRAYYLKEPYIKPRTPNVVLDYINDVRDGKTTIIKEKDIIKVDFVRGGQDMAPHCKLKLELEKDLAQGDFIARWEARCLDVLIKIADYPGIDPVLRAEVLKRGLAMARNGSEAFDSRLLVETANRLAGAET